MEYDQLLTKHVGEFGRFQKRAVAILSLREIFSAFQFMGVVFLAAAPDFVCKSSPAYSTIASNNCSFEETKSLLSPPKADGSGFSSCLVYDKWNISDSFLGYNLSCSDDLRDRRNDTSPCTEWEYDRSQHADTIATQWDLVCDDAWKRPTIASVYLAGVGVGGFVGAWFSDRFGRKIVLLVCEVIAYLCSFAVIYSPVYPMHVVLKFLLAAFMSGSSTSFVFASEMVGPSWRGFVGTYITLVWAMGYVLLSGVAFAMRFYTWQTLALALTIPQASYFILVFCFVPESPRWLYLHNRYDEAETIVRQIAKGNGTVYPDNVKLYEGKKEGQKETMTTLVDLFLTPGIRKLTLIGLLNWSSAGFLYWGISMNTSELGGNMYLNAFISAAVEVPALAFLPWFINRYGRIKIYVLSIVLAGVVLLLTLAIPAGHQAVVITFSMISKFLASVAVATLWVYTPEAYPTCIRSQGLFTSILSTRLISFAAPYVMLLEGKLPLVIFGLPCVIAGGLFMLLPETRNTPLMQSIEDGEKFLKKKPGLNIRAFCCRNPQPTGTAIDTVTVPATEDERKELEPNGLDIL